MSEAQIQPTKRSVASRLRTLMLPLLVVVAALLAAPAAFAQGGEAGQTPAPAAQQPGGDHGHAAKGTLDMDNADFFKKQFAHSVPYTIWPLDAEGKPDASVPAYLHVWNVQPWQWVALGLMLVLFLPVVGSFGKGNSGWGTRVLRGFCLWIRDEMVYKVMGKEEGRPFVPMGVNWFRPGTGWAPQVWPAS